MTDREIWREYAKALAASGVNPKYIPPMADDMLKAEKERWNDNDTDSREF